METIVAALIAATVALLVAVIDRRLVAREEHLRWERTERRQVYGRFLGAVYVLGQAEAAGAATPHQIEEVGASYCELELIAGREVGPLALAMVQLSFDRAPAMATVEQMSDLRIRLAQAARRELGIGPA